MLLNEGWTLDANKEPKITKDVAIFKRKRAETVQTLVTQGPAEPCGVSGGFVPLRGPQNGHTRAAGERTGRW